MRRSPWLTLLVALLVLWVVLALIGLLVKGLFWLLVIGVVLFALTALFGGARSRR